MNFIQMLNAAWRRTYSMLCVGLDPEPARFPPPLTGRADTILEFCRAIVDATAPYACAFKPQIAYFSAYRADALTVNPYLGTDSIAPYFAHPDKGVIVLCRTSNEGGAEVQLQRAGNAYIYQIIAQRAVKQWNANGQLDLVMGATFPKDIAIVRRIAGDKVPLLIPGAGVQGGEIRAAVQAGCTRQGNGLLINASRAILYAGNDADFALAAARAAQRMRDTIRSHI